MKQDQRLSAVVDTSHSPGARLMPLSVGDVRVLGGFWRERLDVLHKATLPSQLEQCNVSGRLDNFRRAAGIVDQPFQGKFYSDSDVYKWMEAVSWVLADDPTSELAGALDEVIDLVAAAQQPDGYLNTYFSVDRVDEQLTDLAVMHELYCIGHLIQAAVAHYRITGSTALLDVARRAADHLGRTFGPDRRRGACGHPGIEMALVELARTTGEPRYLDLAVWFIEEHGQQPPTISGKAYHQDHEPMAEQRHAVDHVVRAIYLYCAAADVELERPHGRYQTALDALWTDIVSSKTYLTGGLGARWEREAFGEPYELPNHRAYAETCAAIASIMWNWRLFLASGDVRYADVMEWTLYNAMLAGISLTGDEFYYQNPLADEGGHRRSPWFRTACCPPNIARTVASIGGYLYAGGPDTAYVVHYASSAAEVSELGLLVTTDYPHDGQVRIEITTAPDRPVALALRRPGWAQNATVLVNGVEQAPMETAGWLAVRRSWQMGDVLQLELPLPVSLVTAHPRIANLTGRLAVTRGPLVYCVEAADNPGVHPSELRIAAGSTGWRPTESSLPGVPAVRTTAVRAVSQLPTASPYGRLDRSRDLEREPVTVTAIPYYAWGNRQAGPMAVWLTAAEPTEE